ncbi:MAG: ribosome-associated translation inhibitor RaiA [bacterium]
MEDMRIVIKGNNIRLTEALKNYVREKIGRLKKYFEGIKSAEVELTYQDSRSADKTQKVEVTLSANGVIFRCEEASVNMYASIDIAAEKLERQLRRFKQRLYQRSRVLRGAKKDSAAKPPSQPRAADEPEPKIVKMKRFAVKPMEPLEASLQMEMLNHNFFVFLNSESEQVNVIYKRNDGNYGLIEPELE